MADDGERDRMVRELREEEADAAAAEAAAKPTALIAPAEVATPTNQRGDHRERVYVYVHVYRKQCQGGEEAIDNGLRQ